MKRRNFIKSSATAAASFSLIPSTVLGKTFGNIAPSDKVNLACVGIGHRGGSVTCNLIESGLANPVAFCDVDMGAPQTHRVLGKYPDVPRFKDFREMFDKMGGEIDAVSVATPDFSHFPITMLAMSMGIHVYVEKPMARTFNEVELMIKGAEKYKVVTQMGNQGHSGAGYYQFKAWKDAGIIKDITAITANHCGDRRWHGFDPKMTKFPEAEKIPESLDWDTWLATANQHDYNKDFIDGQWRCWYDFGMGALGDWGAHIIDSAHEFLELGLPFEIDPVKLEGHNPFFFPKASTLAFKFPKRGDMPPVKLTWYDGIGNFPPKPEGFGEIPIDTKAPQPTDGSEPPRKFPTGKILYGKNLTFRGGSKESLLEIIPKERAIEMEASLPQVPETTSDHYANFLLACMGKEKSRSSFDVAGPLSQVFNLGVLAQRLNTKLSFDRETKQITNNPLANMLLTGAQPRKGWEEYYKL